MIYWVHKSCTVAHIAYTVSFHFAICLNNTGPPRNGLSLPALTSFTSAQFHQCCTEELHWDPKNGLSLLRWSPAPWSFTSELRLSKNAGTGWSKWSIYWIIFGKSFTDTSKHSIYLELHRKTRANALVLGTGEEVIILCVCVARRIHNHDNATRVTQHNAQYARLLSRWGYSTVYNAQNNSRAYEIMLANNTLTLLCLYLHFWSEESGEHVRDQRCKEPVYIITSPFLGEWKIMSKCRVSLLCWFISNSQFDSLHIRIIC